MDILIDRFAKKMSYTIGKLYINGLYFCDTLEDTDRGLTNNMSSSQVKSKKVYGKTAIPTGTYELTLKIQSPKYYSRAAWRTYNNGYMPRVLNVPGFDGILIHPGNKDTDTLGCLLVGENKIKGQLINSNVVFKKLYPILKKASDAGEKITITYK